MRDGSGGEDKDGPVTRRDARQRRRRVGGGGERVYGEQRVQRHKRQHVEPLPRRALGVQRHFQHCRRVGLKRHAHRLMFFFLAKLLFLDRGEIRDENQKVFRFKLSKSKS